MRQQVLCLDNRAHDKVRWACGAYLEFGQLQCLYPSQYIFVVSLLVTWKSSHSAETSGAGVMEMKSGNAVETQYQHNVPYDSLHAHETPHPTLCIH
jgi:hypothetical protein